jgi:hypothetical protein
VRITDGLELQTSERLVLQLHRLGKSDRRALLYERSRGDPKTVSTEGNCLLKVNAISLNNVLGY